jgi:hypothetical protein
MEATQPRSSIAMTLRSAVPILLAVVAIDAGAQQPNGAGASMTVGGASGPPYPIATTVRTSTPAFFALSGAPGAPFIVAVSATGATSPGSLVTAGGTVDLPVVPPPLLALDGTSHPGLVLDGAGTYGFAVPVPPAGTPPFGIPPGHQEAIQAAIGDPTSPVGFTLTAATQVTVVQGPIITDLTLGDDGAVPVNTAPHGFALPFFGTSYTQVWICVNGFITLGQPDTDFTSTPAEFNAGYPRLAAFWTDLEQPAGAVVRSTVDPNPPAGQAPFLKVEWIGVPDWGVGISHTFSAVIDATGFCRIAHAVTTNASLYPTLCGIGPGGGLNPQSMKDLSALQAGGGAVGAALESFYEWYGLLGMPGYTWTTSTPFDLFGLTLDFLPSGAGSPPASTTSYSLY